MEYVSSTGMHKIRTDFLDFQNKCPLSIDCASLTATHTSSPATRVGDPSAGNLKSGASVQYFAFCNYAEYG